MDAERFDSLTIDLSTTDTRRRIVRLLAVLPLGMVLGTLLDGGPAATAKKNTSRPPADDDHGSSHRRQRRKARKRHRPGQDQKHNKDNRKGQRADTGKRRKTCVPDSLAHTCAGACATEINNCGAQVECGSCACTPLCAECETCSDRTGLCEPRPANEACGSAATCVNGVETPRDTCDGAGSCQPGSPRDCDPYQCDGDACATTCEIDDDCVDGAFCDDTDHCVAQRALGEACGREGECQSGFCVEGDITVDKFCCDSACTGECRACDGDGFEGQCKHYDDIGRFCF